MYSMLVLIYDHAFNCKVVTASICNPECIPVIRRVQLKKFIIKPKINYYRGFTYLSDRIFESLLLLL